MKFEKKILLLLRIQILFIVLHRIKTLLTMKNAKEIQIALAIAFFGCALFLGIHIVELDDEFIPDSLEELVLDGFFLILVAIGFFILKNGLNESVVSKMEKTEYCVISCSSEIIDQKLRELSFQGWEVVGNLETVAQPHGRYPRVNVPLRRIVEVEDKTGE